MTAPTKAYRETACDTSATCQILVNSSGAASLSASAIWFDLVMVRVLIRPARLLFGTGLESRYDDERRASVRTNLDEACSQRICG